MRTLLLAVTSIALAACGSGGGSDIDAAPRFDSAPPSVQAVTCPGGEDATVTTSGSMFSPMTSTIPVDGIVKFVMIVGSGHNVVSTTAGETFAVGFGETKCFQFTRAGTFTFKCGPHNFTGSVVVQ
jgi:plastocyanin